VGRQVAVGQVLAAGDENVGLEHRVVGEHDVERCDEHP